MGLTHSPDPPSLAPGAGTAAQQAARPRAYASTDGTGWSNEAPANATNASWGQPGYYSNPVNPIPPANLAQLNAWAVIADVATPWTGTQWIETKDGQPAHWNGTTWVAGKSPAADPPTRSVPGRRPGDDAKR